MANYLSIWFHFKSNVNPWDLIAPLFDHPEFAPVAAGGLSNANWFLGGYDLRDFVARFTRMNNWHEPKGIEIGAGIQARERPYLESLRQAILDPKVDLPHRLSPFESPDETQSFTQVNDRFGAEARSALSAWCGRFPNALLYLCGMPQIKLPWTQSSQAQFAYRPLVNSQSVLSPYVDFSIHRNPPHGNTIGFSLFTFSEVWIDDDCGAYNLNVLADLTRAFTTANQENYLGFYIDIEGISFHQKGSEIFAAFSEFLPYID